MRKRRGRERGREGGVRFEVIEAPFPLRSHVHTAQAHVHGACSRRATRPLSDSRQPTADSQKAVTSLSRDSVHVTVTSVKWLRASLSLSITIFPPPRSLPRGLATACPDHVAAKAYNSASSHPSAHDQGRDADCWPGPSTCRQRSSAGTEASPFQRARSAPGLQ